MNGKKKATPFLKDVELKRMGGASKAGLWMCSLPVPRETPAELSLGGHSTYVKPVGQWFDAEGEAPRRQMLFADGKNSAPVAVNLGAANEAPAAEPPAATTELFARSQDAAFIWERHLLRLSYGDLSVCFALGLRRSDGVHWWEACRMTVLSETPECREIEMGGAIPIDITDFDQLSADPGYPNKYLHRHNWVNGHIYARLHSNGVCEFFVHHINSKFFDDGRRHEDAVPVIGMRVDRAADGDDLPMGAWDGEVKRMQFGGVSFDLSEAADLATPEQPGSFEEGEEFTVWQPYMGMGLFGGIATKARTGDDYVIHAEDHVILRGMARTVRFSLSLSPDRSPVVKRYQAPAWWYGHCEELMPESLLPVDNSYDKTMDACRRWLNAYSVPGGFEVGHVPRGASGPADGRRHEPGWEGEVPYGQFLLAWRYGKARDHDQAMRSAYCFTDTNIDHAAKSVRMHGYPPHAFALPMDRLLGPIAAYLETGDTYLLNTAKATLDNAHWRQMNSWPRLAVGRDACYIRGLVFMYRYFNDKHYLEMAREGVRTVCASQRPEGSFGDQGGGSGLHQWGGYITKPWMGCMAVGPVLDYLELFPDDEAGLQCVKKFGDWLMRERFDHDGVMGVSYQHDFAGTRRFYEFYRGRWTKLPSKGLWHVDYLARVLTFCALRFRDASYFDAWAESFNAGRERRGGDHSCAQSLQYLPWVQAKLWNARLTSRGIRVQPQYLGARTPRRGAIHTPAGTISLNWSGKRIHGDRGVATEPAILPWSEEHQAETPNAAS